MNFEDILNYFKKLTNKLISILTFVRINYIRKIISYCKKEINNFIYRSKIAYINFFVQIFTSDFYKSNFGKITKFQVEVIDTIWQIIHIIIYAIITIFLLIILSIILYIVFKLLKEIQLILFPKKKNK